MFNTTIVLLLPMALLGLIELRLRRQGLKLFGWRACAAIAVFLAGYVAVSAIVGRVDWPARHVLLPVYMALPLLVLRLRRRTTPATTEPSAPIVPSAYQPRDRQVRQAMREGLTSGLVAGALFIGYSWLVIGAIFWPAIVFILAGFLILRLRRAVRAIST